MKPARLWTTQETDGTMNYWAILHGHPYPVRFDQPIQLNDNCRVVCEKTGRGEKIETAA